jgi:hypothetical protein
MKTPDRFIARYCSLAFVEKDVDGKYNKKKIIKKLDAFKTLCKKTIQLRRCSMVFQIMVFSIKFELFISIFF